MANIHVLKTDPKFFDLRGNLKPYEIRKNDRDFQVGDYVILAEFASYDKGFTGNTSELYRIEYIFSDEEYVKEDYVILTLKPVRKITYEENKVCF